MRFFFFGLLSDPELLELVIGRPPPGRPFPRARLPGHRLAKLHTEPFPALVPAPGRHVEGVIVEPLSETDVDRILFYESLEYRPAPVTVQPIGGGAPLAAQAFMPTGRVAVSDEEWRLEEWRARDKARELRLAELWMAFYGRLDVHEADRLWDEALAQGRPIEDLVREVCGNRRRRARR